MRRIVTNGLPFLLTLIGMFALGAACAKAQQIVDAKMEPTCTGFDNLQFTATNLQPSTTYTAVFTLYSLCPGSTTTTTKTVSVSFTTPANITATGPFTNTDYIQVGNPNCEAYQGPNPDTACDDNPGLPSSGAAVNYSSTTGPNGGIYGPLSLNPSVPTTNNGCKVYALASLTQNPQSVFDVNMEGYVAPNTDTVICLCLGNLPNFANLYSAAPYTVFALDGNGPQTATFSLDTVNGQVAVSADATVQNNAPSVINGNVFVDSGGKFSGPGKVNGTLYTGQNLAGAVTDALNASSYAAGLMPNFTYGNISSNTTVTGNHGLNVIDITGNVNLNNASLTFCGPPDASFVVNLTGSINLVGTGGITVCSGTLPGQLLINMTGTGSINTHVGNIVQGTLLGPRAGGSLDGSFGSLLLGKNFSLMSGVLVNFEGCK